MGAKAAGKQRIKAEPWWAAVQPAPSLMKMLVRPSMAQDAAGPHVDSAILAELIYGVAVLSEFDDGEPPSASGLSEEKTSSKRIGSDSCTRSSMCTQRRTSLLSIFEACLAVTHCFGAPAKHTSELTHATAITLCGNRAKPLPRLRFDGRESFGASNVRRPTPHAWCPGRSGSPHSYPKSV